MPMFQTYFNADALHLIRILITGGATIELEQIMAEGVGMVKSTQATQSLMHVRNRCRVALMPLEDSVLEDFSVSWKANSTCTLSNLR